MLSKSAKYAIRAMEFLVANSNQESKFRSAEIAASIEVPQPFLSKILQDLSKGGLVTSLKGPTGGFFISSQNRDKTLWDVVLCIDGDTRFNECYLGRRECNANNPCSIHDIAVEFRSTLYEDLKSRRIEWLKE